MYVSLQCVGRCYRLLNRGQTFKIIGIIHGTHPGGGRRVSLQEKKPICVSPRDGPRRTGPPGSGQPTPTLCTNHFLCLGFIKHHIQSRRKSSILPRKCRLSPLFPSLHRNVSSFLIPFITIRVGVDPHLHFAVIFWYRRFDSVQWVQIKVASLDLLRFLKGKTVDIVFNVRISAVSK
jgi:hypothetical protein